VIASYLVEPYYLSHWSALNYYGYTEQTPSAVYITTTKPRNRKNILNTQYIFVTVTKHKMFGSTEIKIENSTIKISTPDKTIADCLDHPEHCGGIDEIAKAIYFEHSDLNMENILKISERMGNKTIIKRLGYLIELFGLDSYEYLFEGVKLSKGYSNLDPKLPEKGKINEKWKLRINAKINPEQWMG
jgi:predicted transcriptional regulator of viral defense system